MNELCALYLNGHEIYVQPFFNPTEDSPYIDKLYVFLGVDCTGDFMFVDAPPWLLEMANDQLYDDIMRQYEETAADEPDGDAWL